MQEPVMDMLLPEDAAKMDKIISSPDSAIGKELC